MKQDVARTGTAGLVFPGAGIAPSGYEAQFFNRHAGLMGPLMARSSEFTGTDLEAALTMDGMDGLDALSTQVFTYAYSLGMNKVLLSKGVVPVLVAGHSLGIYAALAAARCVSFEDGLALVKTAYDLATTACQSRDCGMLATAGLTLTEVDEILGRLAAPTLLRVITNSSMSQVVAGDLKALEAFEKAARDADATRILWLDREVAYHHPTFLAKACGDFAKAMAGIEFKDPAVPIISSLNADTLTTADQARDFTVQNLSSPIDWRAVLLAFGKRGVETVFETGPGTTLTRMGRFVDTAFSYLNVKKISRRGG
ncbi:MAG: ACP S-malonyltransferase [Deltaproteobacteria bacterium]|nr:ACP S-malonyltransferase [Deltaproteobacteria bacterium]